MHHNISTLSPIYGKLRVSKANVDRHSAGRTRGITGLVYSSVRTITQGVGFAINFALTQLDAQFASTSVKSPRNEKLDAIKSVINGVIGDRLAASGNTLAIQAHLRASGEHPSTLPKIIGTASNAVVATAAKVRWIVMVHGLCMNDWQWTRDGHNHGEQLAQLMNAQVYYFVYNSGESITKNGEALARSLQNLLIEYPALKPEITLICHSMGGLVSRRACQFAEQFSMPWFTCIKAIVFLGTPHQGALLERAGQWVDRALGFSPYSAPFARLSKVRSVGINDLCNGIPNSPVDALPSRIACYAVAASKEKCPSPGVATPLKRAPARVIARLHGDGLVTVASALGDHKQLSKSLAIAPANRLVCYETDHFDLLSSKLVFKQLEKWLVP